MAKKLYIGESYEIYDGEGTLIVTRKDDSQKSFVRKADVGEDKVSLLVKSIEINGLKDETGEALFELGNAQKQLFDLKMKVLDLQVKAFTW